MLKSLKETKLFPFCFFLEAIITPCHPHSPTIHSEKNELYLNLNEISQSSLITWPSLASTTLILLSSMGPAFYCLFWKWKQLLILTMPVSQGTQRKTDEVMDRKALWKLQSTVLVKRGSVMLVLLAKG